MIPYLFRVCRFIAQKSMMVYVTAVMEAMNGYHLIHGKVQAARIRALMSQLNRRKEQLNVWTWFAKAMKGDNMTCRDQYRNPTRTYS